MVIPFPSRPCALAAGDRVRIDGVAAVVLGVLVRGGAVLVSLIEGPQAGARRAIAATRLAPASPEIC